MLPLDSPSEHRALKEHGLDLPPEIVYRAYEERWQIELVMRYYKSACEFDDTRVHSDYSVIGREFCDFLATVLTWQLIKINPSVGKMLGALGLVALDGSTVNGDDVA